KHRSKKSVKPGKHSSDKKNGARLLASAPRFACDTARVSKKSTFSNRGQRQGACKAVHLEDNNSCGRWIRRFAPPGPGPQTAVAWLPDRWKPGRHRGCKPGFSPSDR